MDPSLELDSKNHPHCMDQMTSDRHRTHARRQYPNRYTLPPYLSWCLSMKGRHWSRKWLQCSWRHSERVTKRMSIPLVFQGRWNERKLERVTCPPNSYSTLTLCECVCVRKRKEKKKERGKTIRKKKKRKEKRRTRDDREREGGDSGGDERVVGQRRVIRPDTEENGRVPWDVVHHRHIRVNVAVAKWGNEMGTEKEPFWMRENVRKWREMKGKSKHTKHTLSSGKLLYHPTNWCID